MLMTDLIPTIERESIKTRASQKYDEEWKQWRVLEDEWSIGSSFWVVGFSRGDFPLFFYLDFDLLSARFINKVQPKFPMIIAIPVSQRNVSLTTIQ